MSGLNKPISYNFQESHGLIPNHPVYPVLFYKETLFEEVEACFNRNNWKNSWRGGVYDYHHYHSTSHEVLGVTSGSGIIMLGGEKGKEQKMIKGDVVIIPAGVGHKLMDSTDDFEVVGAYPFGSSYDIKTENQVDFEQGQQEIERAPFPDQDPVHGKHGPLFEKWQPVNK
ncbi:cupin domain-containing protein [Halobacillus salinarum]|uniref:Cupin domain-containing protein n=1 Tax=Halobacillus salinarum TaxID=2932257 RepID=A0ABY4EQR5_9BACI|nr:cupin domain-containing protein [Halobacillus salinarum]UOQ46528.1 cupin domain-containing protein [Halobacillus salinarum]